MTARTATKDWIIPKENHKQQPSQRWSLSSSKPSKTIRKSRLFSRMPTGSKPRRQSGLFMKETPSSCSSSWKATHGLGVVMTFSRKASGNHLLSSVVEPLEVALNAIGAKSSKGQQSALPELQKQTARNSWSWSNESTQNTLVEILATCNEMQRASLRSMKTLNFLEKRWTSFPSARWQGKAPLRSSNNKHVSSTSTKVERSYTTRKRFTSSANSTRKYSMSSTKQNARMASWATIHHATTLILKPAKRRTMCHVLSMTVLTTKGLPK